MKHAKFVSFTLCGAQTVQKAVKLLPDFRCERYARTVDASLSGTSLKRFAQQAMVDCDLIVFVGRDRNRGTRSGAVFDGKSL